MSPDLATIIGKRIREEGPIPFESFMEMALYYPGLGYYNAPSTEIGKKGDFYTSPHLHPIFGMVLARQLEECWAHLGKIDAFTVVEQGAGRGYLAHDILDYLRGREIYASLNYTIIEMNPAGRERQMRLLERHGKVVQWEESVEGIAPFSGCLLSNELPDAFPVHIVEMDDELKEMYVDRGPDGFIEVPGQLSTPDLTAYCDDFSLHFPKGYRTEINLRIRKWLKTLSDKLKRGFVITIDYGYGARDYYSEDRSRGTLMCYYRHRAHEDPYTYVGLQDMTAHVNFSSVKKWGEEYGLKTLGYTGQGIYMVSMGLDEIITERYLGKEGYSMEAAKIKGLIMPGGMGESHKIMIQYKGVGSPVMRGFTIRNRLGQL